MRTQDEAAAGMSRRRFLSRIGVLSVAPLLPAAAPEPAATELGERATGGGPAGAAMSPRALNPVLQMLAKDTMGGLVAFVVPGADAFSIAQGALGTDRRGGIHARAHEFMLEAVDSFYPVPERYAQAMAQAFATGVSETPIPEDLARIGPRQARSLDDLLQPALRQQGAAPLSLVMALTMNYCATETEPSSVSGRFLSPFANLTFEQKLEAWRLLEEDNTELTAMIDGQLPEPNDETVSGLLKFVAGALLEFAAFGSYSEWGVFDRETGTARRRPIGWEIAGYMPERSTPSNGWDELRGYYRGRRSADAGAAARGAADA